MQAPLQKKYEYRIIIAPQSECVSCKKLKTKKKGLTRVPFIILRSPLELVVCIWVICSSPNGKKQRNRFLRTIIRTQQWWHALPPKNEYYREIEREREREREREKKKLCARARELLFGKERLQTRIVECGELHIFTYLYAANPQMRLDKRGMCYIRL